MFSKTFSASANRISQRHYIVLLTINQGYNLYIIDRVYAVYIHVPDQNQPIDLTTFIFRAWKKLEFQFALSDKQLNNFACIGLVLVYTCADLEGRWLPHEVSENEKQ